MWEYRGLWKYCGKEQIKDMLLSFQLLGDTDWPKEKILACLFALSNHPESHYHSVKIPKRRGGYRTLDVPDGLVYQWAEDYFNDENAEEDHKNDEKFIPKPYVSAARKKAQGKAAKKPVPAAKPKAEKPKDTGMEQISLM